MWTLRLLKISEEADLYREKKKLGSSTIFVVFLIQKENLKDDLRLKLKLSNSLSSVGSVSRDSSFIDFMSGFFLFVNSTKFNRYGRVS